MLTQLKNNPAVRKELQELGYSDEQIPDWVAEAETAVEAAKEKFFLLPRSLLCI
jgi:hypothetical protein